MNPLPTQTLRSNLGTWAVPDRALPSLANVLLGLPPEPYDLDFAGQHLDTVYFDTPQFDLRKARLRNDQYCTVRIRCYPGEVYALSVKTEEEKYRPEISSAQADAFLQGSFERFSWPDFLPAHLISRLQALVPGDDLFPVVKVSFHRYARENATDRLTLDIDITTDTGLSFPTNVLEYKSTSQASPPTMKDNRYHPIKLSKFLWATNFR
jgi:hypothetical protein